MKKYIPKPMDLTHVEIPEEIKNLVEVLAENVHDEWALGRMKDGWTYGPERNDVEKKHPCLVSYSELPESEKSYDRVTAETTIKAVLAAGFKIEKNENNSISASC